MSVHTSPPMEDPKIRPYILCTSPLHQCKEAMMPVVRTMPAETGKARTEIDFTDAEVLEALKQYFAHLGQDMPEGECHLSGMRSTSHVDERDVSPTVTLVIEAY
ncbi:hypothetical protein [Nioella sp.]|uniref:hypothetical protein n=1 Tax=Nioella sp. TaxID=1912091 RepID=UPI003516E9B2